MNNVPDKMLMTIRYYVLWDVQEHMFSLNFGRPLSGPRQKHLKWERWREHVMVRDWYMYETKCDFQMKSMAIEIFIYILIQKQCSEFDKLIVLSCFSFY